MSDSIIVTGGAGFIGRNVVAALNARGLDNILIVDHLGHGDKWRNLVGLRFSDYIDKADFLERLRAGGIAAPRAVFHMGACTSTTEADADYLMRNNYQYTRTLCDWTLGRAAQFIYASSAAVYGDGANGYIDDENRMDILRPLNGYAFSKLVFDQWARRNGLLDKIVGLRFFNVYGPGEAHKGEMRSVVHKAYGQICATGEMTLFKSYRDDYADGEQQRDFVYVADVVAMALHFFDHPKLAGVFNCGAGVARTWLDLGHALFAALKLPPRIRFIEMPESLRPRYQYHTLADLAKLRTAGFAVPTTSLESGVENYIRELRAI